MPAKAPAFASNFIPVFFSHAKQKQKYLPRNRREVFKKKVGEAARSFDRADSEATEWLDEASSRQNSGC